uniref:Uncharacterized protein n=1 Tax=Amphimedon queenslandica TaxID=400682 RepID=A0A1X7SQ56_AMPQE
MSSLRSIHLMLKITVFIAEKDEVRVKEGNRGQRRKGTETKRRVEIVKRRMFYLTQIGKKKEGRPLTWNSSGQLSEGSWNSLKKAGGRGWGVVRRREKKQRQGRRQRQARDRDRRKDWDRDRERQGKGI